MSHLAKALPFALAALAGAGAAALPAAAQVAGVYAGTSADGNGVNFTVATDMNTGQLTITQGGVGFSALCKDGSLFNSGWGFGVSAPDIVNHRVSFVPTDPYFTFKVKLTFSQDGQSATGTIETVTPELTPVGPRPKHALFCTAATQSLGLTLQPPGAKLPALQHSQSKAADH